jgi:hypothetical protein
MKELNKNNIEAWLLDYIEGNLSPEQSVKLEFFLSENPEYASMLEEYEPVKLEPEAVNFVAKNSLKKGFSINNSFEERCIAYHEGLLNAYDKAAFEQEINSNITKKHLSNQYQKTHLIPDYSIVYEHKSALKQSLLSRHLVSYLPYAAAASVLLIAGMFFLEHKSDRMVVKSVASVQVPVPQVSDKNPEQPSVQPSIKGNLPVEKQQPQNKKAENTNESQPPVLKEDIMIQPDLAQNNNKFDYSDEELSNYKGISILAPVAMDKIRTGNELVAITSIESRRVKVQNADSSSEGNTLSEFDKLMATANRNLSAKEGFSMFHIAQKLVNKINDAIGSDMKLEKHENADEDSETLAFDSKYFGFTKTTKK